MKSLHVSEKQNLFLILYQKHEPSMLIYMLYFLDMQMQVHLDTEFDQTLIISAMPIYTVQNTA